MWPFIPPFLPPLHFANQAVEADAKKAYFCQKCENHNIRHPRRNHKTECPYKECDCEKCVMVDERCRLNAEIKTQFESDPLVEHLIDEEAAQRDNNATIERKPCCQRCRAHGLKKPLRNHKRQCEFKTCACDKCKMVDERRKLMAKQIKLRREQRRDRERADRKKEEEERAEFLKTVAAAQPHLLQAPFPHPPPHFMGPPPPGLSFAQFHHLPPASSCLPSPSHSPAIATGVQMASPFGFFRPPHFPFPHALSAFSAAVAAGFTTRPLFTAPMSEPREPASSSTSSSVTSKEDEGKAEPKFMDPFLPPPTPNVDVVN